MKPDASPPARPTVPLNLNDRAYALCEPIIRQPELYKAAVYADVASGVVIDLGISVPGSLAAGVRLAEVSLAALAEVRLTNSHPAFGSLPSVQVQTDFPVAACLASQYGGWQIRQEQFFAIGSGPMRAAIGRETLFDTIGYREQSETVVGVLETSKLPPPEVVVDLAAAAGTVARRLTLLVAPTASQAGGIQIVARSIETALHKLAELQFDLTRIESAWGVAPLPPVAANDIEAIGRTNDAILYGAEVVLWMRGDDDSLTAIGPRVPSCASSDHGRPFGEIFASYQHDFYSVDPLLFSPAVVTLVNLDTGRTHRFGSLEPEVIARSFGG